MFIKQQRTQKLATILYLSLTFVLAHTSVFASQVVRPATPDGSTWCVRTQFISGNGSVGIRWSGEYYQHIGTTSGFNISSSGQQTPALVKVQTQSYELSDVRTTPCQNRTT